MKVKELIAELSKQNPETIVAVNGYEGGYDEVNTIISRVVERVDHKGKPSWDGEFEEYHGKPALEVEPPETFIILVLPRKSC